jgi:hydrogenase maturation protease
MTAPKATLVLGWGNPGRGDDGLGPAFVAAVSQAAPQAFTFETDYQLAVEDAAEAARYERVLFVDASRDGPAPFMLRRLRPQAEPPGFSTHEVAPGAVLALCEALFHASPEGWLLGIRGYDFDRFESGLSERAADNLARAVAHFAASMSRNETWGEPWLTRSA